MPSDQVVDTFSHISRATPLCENYDSSRSVESIANNRNNGSFSKVISVFRKFSLIPKKKLSSMVDGTSLDVKSSSFSVPRISRALDYLLFCVVLVVVEKESFVESSCSKVFVFSERIRRNQRTRDLLN